MNTPLHTLAVVVLLATLPAPARQQPSPAKTIPDSINYMWKMVQRDFTSLAEAMPEDKWNFKPTQGAFIDVRTFSEQVNAQLLWGCDAWNVAAEQAAKQIVTYLYEHLSRGGTVSVRGVP